MVLFYHKVCFHQTGAFHKPCPRMGVVGQRQGKEMSAKKIASPNEGAAEL
jgi:hypothetical protein